jgi:3',5'-cyclic AMP phosphodiesterase CpdA
MSSRRFGLFGPALLVLPLLAGCPGPESCRRIDPPVEVAGPQEFSPFFFVLAGDPQIGMTPGGMLLDKRHLIEEARQVNRLGPPFVLIAGDLAHTPTRLEWRLFDEGLREFRCPVKLIPGNHDLQGDFWGNLDYYREHYGQDYYVFTYNNCDFIALNSTVLSSRFSEPYKTEAQTQWPWLEKALAASRKNGRTHVFIFTHRPPFMHRQDDRESLSVWEQQTRRPLLDLCRRYGAKVFLCGHIHRSIETKADGFEVYTVAGTAVAWTRPGLGYRIFRVYADRIEQQFVPLDHPLESLPPATTSAPPAN